MRLKSYKNVELELKVLNKINERKNISQRAISKDLDVALGLANSLIKKFVKKGFLKLKEAPMRRYFYYLTPKGLIEKSKLTKDFLETSLKFFRQAKQDYEEEFKKIKKNNKFVILYGISDFTDIAILAAKVEDIEIKYIFDEISKVNQYCGYEVIKNLKQVSKKNNIFFVITKLVEDQEKLNNLKKFELYQPRVLKR